MTDEQLAEIRARMQDATPGPWRHANTRIPFVFAKDATSPTERELVVHAFDLQCHSWTHGSKKHRARLCADAAFIANAPADIADLLAEVERLRGELATACAHAEAVDRGRWHSRAEEEPPKTGEWVEFWWSEWEATDLCTPVCILRWQEDAWRDEFDEACSLGKLATHWRELVGPGDARRRDEDVFRKHR